MSSRQSLLWIALFLGLCNPVMGFAQYNLSPNFSLTPAAVIQGQCYTVRVSNWPSAVLNVGYTTSWTGQQYIWGWPSLDSNGSALICTSANTATGTYTYNQASNTIYYQWWAVNAAITVNAPPPQPTYLTFAPNTGYAGNDCYTMTAGNAANMMLDLYYTFNAVSQPVWTTSMDGSGQWRYCLKHHDRVGNYIFYQMKNHQASTWVNVTPPASHTVKAPQPKWFAAAPASIVQGQSYQISAGNGAAATLDVQYSLNNGAVQTIIGWPTLVPLDGNYGPNGSPDGYVNIGTGGSTPLGKYVFTAVRNTQNSTWVPVTASLSICPSGVPTISSIVPNTVTKGATASVTISGAGLCAVVLQSLTNTGLWFTNVTWNSPFTSVTATANTSASTPPGQGQIRITTPAGSVTAPFTVAPPVGLTKEYIYLGDRVLSTESP